MSLHPHDFEAAEATRGICKMLEAGPVTVDDIVMIQFISPKMARRLLHKMGCERVNGTRGWNRKSVNPPEESA